MTGRDNGPRAAAGRGDVVCMGHALVDWLVHADPGEAERFGLHKGAMTLIGRAQADAMAASLPEGSRASGGSAANTAAGIASLGGRSGFIGTVGDDALGELYGKDLESAGVRCVLHRLPAGQAAEGTGRCFVLVTPDADRTMATYLGAAAHVDRSSASLEAVEDFAVLYLEGYLYDSPEAVDALDAAVAIARSAGGLVALSLSDPFVVERHRDRLAAVVDGAADLLFANEAEIVGLTGADDLWSAAEEIRRPGLVAALTRGEEGALVVAGTETLEVAAGAAAVVDTTGAGDLFAAGFLCGFARGGDLRLAGELGALAAAEVISHLGARPQVRLADLAAAAGLEVPAASPSAAQAGSS